MGWILGLSIIAYLVVVMSKAGECYQCGARNPTVYSHMKTRALCDRCWVQGK